MNIKEMCAKKGVSLPELAKAIDESQSLIYKIVNGSRKISPRVQRKLDAFFNESTAQVSTSVQNPVDKYSTIPSTQLSEPGVCPSCGHAPMHYQPREVIEYGERLTSIQELLNILRQECNSAMIRHEVREAFREERCGLATFYLNELNTVVVPLQCVMTILEEDTNANKYAKALIKQTIAHIGRAAERLAAESGKCKPKGVRHDMP